MHRIVLACRKRNLRMRHTAGAAVVLLALFLIQAACGRALYKVQ